MSLTFREVKPPEHVIPACKTMRATLDITKCRTCDISSATPGANGFGFKDVWTPSRKTSVVTELYFDKKPEGYRYEIMAYTTAERENSRYSNDGFIKADSFNKAEAELQEMAKAFLSVCLLTESQRLLDLAEPLIASIMN